MEADSDFMLMETVEDVEASEAIATDSLLTFVVDEHGNKRILLQEESDHDIEYKVDPLSFTTFVVPTP